MHKPKYYRDLLFKGERPNIRPIDLNKDLGILWAAYTKESFKNLPEGASQKEFADFFLTLASEYTKGWIVEDNNKSFKDGYGATGIFFAVDNGYELEPHFEKFSWASRRNTLRSIVSFLQMMRYDKDVGVVNVYANDYNNMNYFKKLHKYGVLNYVGTVPHGDIKGDRHIFYVRGKKRWAA